MNWKLDKGLVANHHLMSYVLRPFTQALIISGKHKAYLPIISATAMAFIREMRSVVKKQTTDQEVEIFTVGGPPPPHRLPAALGDRWVGGHILGKIH